MITKATMFSAVAVGVVAAFAIRVHNGGAMTSQAASQIRAGDPPPCIYGTIRQPCNDKFGLCIWKTTQHDCEGDAGRRCFYCTETSSASDVIKCVKDDLDAWTLVCEELFEPGGCGFETRFSECRLERIVDDDWHCVCTEGVPYSPPSPCDSWALRGWDGNCSRRR
jgi:hypothetical protein